MKVVFDPDTDTLTVVFQSAPVAESDEVGPGVIADYGQRGDVVSLEVLDASTRVDDPRAITVVVNPRSK